MFLKSVLQNKIFINFSFFTTVFLAILFFAIGFNEAERFNIPLFGGINSNLFVNVELGNNKTSNDGFKLFFDDKEIQPTSLFEKNKYLAYASYNKPVYNISLAANALKNIKNIVIVQNKNFYYFEKKDIEKFEKKNEKYIFPKIEYNKNSKYITDKGALKRFFTIFLSVFYNSKFYFLPIVFSILSGIIYCSNKEKIPINLHIKTKYIIFLILFLALFLRITDNNFPLWIDELYTITLGGNPNTGILSAFKDPGNPPLFYIIAKLYSKISGSIEYVLRLLPAIFSVITVFAVYKFLKTNFNQNAGLIAAFSYTINVYAINAAQEYRVYALLGLLTILVSYTLFELVKNPDNKNFIFYTVISLLAVNAHYFEIFVWFSNFILGTILLKDKKIKFIGLNLAAFIGFLPFFFICAFKNGLLDNTFNVLSKTSIYELFIILKILFIKPVLLYAVILIFFALLFKKDEKKFKTLYFYSIYLIITVFVFAYLFSEFIKPIIKDYYFICILPFVSIITALLFYIPFKFKKVFIPLFIFFFIFSFTSEQYFNKAMFSKLREEISIKYAYYNSHNKPSALVITDYLEYMNYYPEYKKENLKLTKRKIADPNSNLYNIVTKNPYDTTYSLLQNLYIADFSKTLEPNYSVYALVSDNGTIFGKIERQ